VEYGVKARFVSVSVEVAYTDSLKSTDITVDEQLRLCLEGTVLSFAVSSLPFVSCLREQCHCNRLRHCAEWIACVRTVVYHIDIHSYLTLRLCCSEENVYSN